MLPDRADVISLVMGETDVNVKMHGMRYEEANPDRWWTTPVGA